MSDLLIRHTVPTDFHEIKKMDSQAFEFALDQGLWDEYDTVVAIYRGELVGFCTSKDQFLKRIYVLERYRRLSFGSRMILASQIDEASVPERCLELQMLLKKLNYRCTGTTLFSSEKGQNAYHFRRKDLIPS